jgi:hypothetical protein
MMTDPPEVGLGNAEPRFDNDMYELDSYFLSSFLP